MVNVQLFSIKGLLIELLLGESSTVWVFVANKCVKSLSFLGEQFDTFDFSKLSKMVMELLLSSSGWEVLDIEIASLL